MKKRTPQQPAAGCDDGHRLTPKEAAALADSWVLPFLCDDETIGDFMLLLYSIAYEPDMTKREEITTGVENALMPYAPAIGDAMRQLLRKRLTVAHSLIKEGGTQ
jgi:hypothetical protein